MNFTKVASGIDIYPLRASLERQPELWDKNPCRLSKRGPHWQTQDIFLRYKDETENIESGDWRNFSDPHIPVWYKSIDFLPEAKPLIFQLMAGVKAEILGGVFIYKLEPGTEIIPHIDKGWHPNFFQKFNICINSNDRAAFCYEEDRMVQHPGDVHYFRNDVKHWVINEGDSPHVVMTVCVRIDQGERVPWSPDSFCERIKKDIVCQQHG